MKHNFVAAIAVVLTVGQIMPVFAWGPGGHKQIADIAWTGLNARAAAQIGIILRAGGSQFQPKNNSVSALRDAFRLSATMPDVIKDDTHTAFEQLVTRYETKPQERCRSFHYYDTPINSQGGAPLDEHNQTPVIPNSNASIALRFAIAAIKRIESQPAIASSDRLEEAWWLGWIEHIVGDLHQPLHCAEDFGINREGDAGGSKFKVIDPISGEATNLHSLWDGAIDRVKFQERDLEGHSSLFSSVSSRWLGDENIAQTNDEAMNLDEMKWIAEGAALAQATVYLDVTPMGAVSNRYLVRQASVVKRRAVLGGLRLSNLLNKLLG